MIVLCWVLSAITMYGCYWASYMIALMFGSASPERTAMFGAILSVAFMQDIRHLNRNRKD